MVRPHRTVSPRPLQGSRSPWNSASDQRQPVRQTVASQEPAPRQGVLRVIDGADSLVEPAARAYSFWAECECPGDCLRDHENE